MTEPARAHEADALYRPLGGAEAWAEVVVDEAPWEGAMARLRTMGGEAPEFLDMVRHGARLAAAHESGALDGVHAGDRGVALALLRGEASLADVGADARPHAAAGAEALALSAADDVGTEAWVRRVHAVACRAQLTHAVHDEHGVQEHVLAAGDYKHHPNHVRTAQGGWRACAPVADVRGEMADLAHTLTSADFAALHPAVQAAYAHHGVAHVGPFADGNGRVARVLAGTYLLRAASIPLLVLADDGERYREPMDGEPAVQVDDVVRRCLDLVDHMKGACATPQSSAALDRWRRRVDAAEAVRAALPAVVEDALARHRRRADLGWLSPLEGAVVGATAERLVIRAPAGPELVVEEVLAVDPHPLSGDGAPMVRAVHARLQAALGPDGTVPALEAWLDRVVSCLALRVAAEVE